MLYKWKLKERMMVKDPTSKRYLLGHFGFGQGILPQLQLQHLPDQALNLVDEQAARHLKQL